MLISFVVRLADAALATGRLAGEVEHVATGERGQFRDAAELCAWCARAGLPEQRAPEPSVGRSDTSFPRKSSS